MLKGLNCKYYLPALCIALASINAASAAPVSSYKQTALVLDNSDNGNKVEVYVSGGPAFFKLRNDTSVAITSVVVNDYSTNEQSHWRGLWGMGVGHSFGNIFKSPFSLSLGVAGYSIHFGNVKGMEYPFASDSIDDTLNYQFTEKSTAVLAEARLFYSPSVWKPFLLLGAGAAWNDWSNYSETPSIYSLSAAPVPTAFGNHTNHSFAYEVGVGVERQLYADVQHKIHYIGSLDYRYVNFGKGRLASFPAETTGDALQSNNISTQAIMLSLKVAFC